jgi:hypothetical protein
VPTRFFTQASSERQRERAERESRERERAESREREQRDHRTSRRLPNLHFLLTSFGILDIKAHRNTIRMAHDFLECVNSGSKGEKK